MQHRLGIPDEDTVPVPLAYAGAPGTEAAPPMLPAPEASPVFVDASGRRQRRVRRLGRLLVIPAAAYVVLLFSTLMGGPTVQSPFLPSAQAPHTAKTDAPAAGTSTARPSASGAVKSRTPSTRSGAPASDPKATAAPAKKAAPGTGTGPTAISDPTAPTSGTRPSPPGSGRGRPSTAPGQGGKPTAHP